MSRETEAKAMFATLCRTLDNMGWHYNKSYENGMHIIKTSAVGDDLDMGLIIRVEESRSLMYLKSPMPVDKSEDNRMDMAVATVIANMAMLNGCFEYDITDGYCAFKLVVPFEGCTISEQVCRYLINVSCDMVDRFNDKMQAVSNGTLSVAEFYEYTQSAFS